MSKIDGTTAVTLVSCLLIVTLGILVGIGRLVVTDQSLRELSLYGMGVLSGWLGLKQPGQRKEERDHAEPR